MNSRRFPIIGAVVAVALVVVALAVIATRGSASSQPASRDAGSTTENAAASDGAVSSTTSSSVAVPVTTMPPTGPYTTPNMPVAVSVGSTKALHSGDVVSVTVSPSNGSQAFGAEARLCRGDASIQVDGDLFPTRAGKCIPKPFSDGTNDFLEVRNQPPYGPLNVNFKVGTGSQTFKLQDGSQTTITCDATHPCQLVLKLQYPNGFGFQGVPLTFG